MTATRLTDKGWYIIIGVLSLLVVGVVTFLIYKSQGIETFDPRIYIIPKINAFLNATVTVLLIIGFILIKQRKFEAHKWTMLSAFLLSVCFLACYIIYHYNAPETKYGGEGPVRYIYFFLLLTHIVLAAIIVPLALLTLYRVWRGDLGKHRKIARWTLPLWLYVTVTGVIIYLMISPFYPAQ